MRHDVEFRELFQQRLIRDLAMHDGMPQIRFRADQLRRFDGVHGHLRCAAADAMHRRHHAALLRRQDQFVQLLLRKDGNAFGGGVICVGSAQIRRAAAERTVRHQL